MSQCNSCGGPSADCDDGHGGCKYYDDPPVPTADEMLDWLEERWYRHGVVGYWPAKEYTIFESCPEAAKAGRTDDKRLTWQGPTLRDAIKQAMEKE